MFLGDAFLLGESPFPANACAHTDVAAQWFSKKDFERLCGERPAVGLTIRRAVGRDLAAKTRRGAAKVAEYLFAEDIDAETQAMVSRAATAQRDLADWQEARIDELLQAIAAAVAVHAPALAEACVQETGMGVAADKVVKIRFACDNVWRSLANRPAAGIIDVESHIPSLRKTPSQPAR